MSDEKMKMTVKLVNGGTVDLMKLFDALQDNINIVATVVKKLQQQQKELSEVCYKGVWQQSLTYKKGNFTTYGSSLWSCVRDTESRPGDGIDWQLCAKSGGH